MVPDIYSNKLGEHAYARLNALLGYNGALLVDTRTRTQMEKRKTTKSDHSAFKYCQTRELQLADSLILPIRAPA